MDKSLINIVQLAEWSIAAGCNPVIHWFKSSIVHEKRRPSGLLFFFHAFEAHQADETGLWRNDGNLLAFLSVSRLVLRAMSGLILNVSSRIIFEFPEDGFHHGRERHSVIEFRDFPLVDAICVQIKAKHVGRQEPMQFQLSARSF